MHLSAPATGEPDVLGMTDTRAQSESPDWDRVHFDVPCPACGELMPDDAPRCAACGDWVTAWSPATERAYGWLWPVVVALLVGVILVIWNKLGR